MAVSSDFTAYVEELLQALGPLTIKRMFGGAGVYTGGLMFGLIADDMLYLKVDGETEARFRAAGSEPFVFADRRGRETPLSYWVMPDEALETPESAAAWAREAIGAALRKRASGPKPRARGRR